MLSEKSLRDTGNGLEREQPDMKTADAEATGATAAADPRIENRFATSSTGGAKDVDSSGIESSDSKSPATSVNTTLAEMGGSSSHSADTVPPTGGGGGKDASGSGPMTDRSNQGLIIGHDDGTPPAGCTQESVKQQRRQQVPQQSVQPQVTLAQQPAKMVQKVNNKPGALTGCRGNASSPKKGRVSEVSQQQQHGPLYRGRPGPTVAGDNTVPQAPVSSPESGSTAVCPQSEAVAASLSSETGAAQVGGEASKGGGGRRHNTGKQVPSTGVGTKAKKGSSPSRKPPAGETPSRSNRGAPDPEGSSSTSNLTSSDTAGGNPPVFGVAGSTAAASSVAIAHGSPAVPHDSNATTARPRRLGPKSGTTGSRAPVAGAMLSTKAALRKEVTKLREALQAILIVVQAWDTPECVTLRKLCTGALEIDLSAATDDSSANIGKMATKMTGSPATGARPHRSRLLRSKRFLGAPPYSPGKRGIRGRNVPLSVQGVAEYGAPVTAARSLTTSNDTTLVGIDLGSPSPQSSNKLFGAVAPSHSELVQAATIEASFHGNVGVTPDTTARMSSYPRLQTKYFVQSQMEAPGTRGFVNHQYYNVANNNHRHHHNHQHQHNISPVSHWVFPGNNMGPGEQRRVHGGLETQRPFSGPSPSALASMGVVVPSSSGYGLVSAVERSSPPPHGINHQLGGSMTARHDDTRLSVFSGGSLPGSASPVTTSGGSWPQMVQQAHMGMPPAGNSRIPQPQPTHSTNQRRSYGGRPSASGASGPAYGGSQKTYGAVHPGHPGPSRQMREMRDVIRVNRPLDGSLEVWSPAGNQRRTAATARAPHPFENPAAGKVLLPFLASPAESNHPICVHIREELRVASTEEAVQKLIAQARSLKIQSLVEMGSKKLRKFQQGTAASTTESSLGTSRDKGNVVDVRGRSEKPVVPKDGPVPSVALAV